MISSFKEFNESLLIKQDIKKKIFFTSDLHFQDERLNLYGRDLMFNNASEVDSYIVDKWNKVVGKDDLTIVVGDISMTMEGLETMERLNGEKWIVKGNYDTSTIHGGTAKYEITDDILSKYFTKVVDELEMQLGDEIVYINHYPVNAKKDYMNICGHIHGLFKVQRNTLNIGCDAWHFSPVSEEIVKFHLNGIRNHYDDNVFAGELVSNIAHRKHGIIVLRAPEENKLAEYTENENICVFLAGPIQGAPNWQENFISILSEKFKKLKLTRDIIIASPRRLKKPIDFNYDVQVDWESKFLQKASDCGVVVFYLPKAVENVDGRSYAQTTRFEMGEWFAKGQCIDNFKIVIGAEEGFDGLRYMGKKFSDSYNEMEIHNNVDHMINEIYCKVDKILSCK